MAWNEVKVENERAKFIIDYLSNAFSIAELCRKYSISRPTAYKWIYRFEKEGDEGLQDRSRAPLTHPKSICNSIKELLVFMRCKHPTWGPRKIRSKLRKDYPELNIPAASTIGDFLKDAGLVTSRKYRRHVKALTQPFGQCNEANKIWAMDFKGWFLTGDGCKCEPFTVTDAYSRFIICCTHVQSKKSLHIQGLLDKAFREYGLPEKIRMDNGPPFGSLGLGGLTKLGVYIVKAGVIPEHIPPGEPQENGVMKECI